MAGSGKTSKNPADRHGRGGRKSTPVAAGSGDVPAWPLREDVSMRARISVLETTIADLEMEIEEETDGRKLGGLRRKYQSATNALAVTKQTLIESSQLELEIWRALWRLPHAEQWRKQGYLREVAQYARHQARAECGSLDDSKEARQRSDRLGLSPRSFAMLGWKVTADPPPAPTATGTDGAAGAGSVTSIAARRSRLAEE